MLGVKEDVYLIEDSFEGLEVNLKTLDYLDKLAMLPEGSVESAVILNDKQGNESGIAFKNKYPDGDFWFFIPYPSAPASGAQTHKLVRGALASGAVASPKKKKVDGGQIKAALREYLSASLAAGDLCECDRDREPLSFAYNDKRNKQIRSLLKKLEKEYGLDLKETDTLEICCGNGMSTAAIRSLFKSVLSIDNDRCAVCNGLYHGILEPSDTMVIDAMELTRYVPDRYDAVLGFMLGTFYEFNKGIWRTIFHETVKSLKVNGFLLLTVNTKEEMDFLAEALNSMGLEGKVIDNRNKGNIYDGWAYFAVR